MTPANTNITYPKITIADFDIDTPRSARPVGLTAVQAYQDPKPVVQKWMRCQRFQTGPQERITSNANSGQAATIPHSIAVPSRRSDSPARPLLPVQGTIQVQP